MFQRCLSLLAVAAAGCSWAAGESAAVAPAAEPAVSVVKPAKAASTNAPRESVITAKKVDYDNKEGVILFDENVVVDNPQFLLKSDRLLVFTKGTNDVNQILAIGNVSISNQNRSATCEKAVYTKQDGTITMTGKPKLMTSGERAGEVAGDKITIWINDERMEVSPGRVTLPAGAFNSNKPGQGADKLFP